MVNRKILGWLAVGLILILVLVNLVSRHGSDRPSESRPDGAGAPMEETAPESIAISPSSGTSVGAAAGPADSRAGEEPAMRWLNFRLSSSGLTLLSSATRPGTVKRQRVAEKQGTVYYRVLSGDGAVVWEGSLRNPRSLYYDYEDKDARGESRLSGGRIDLTDAEFALRIPELDGAAVLEVVDYTTDPAGKPLGTFSLREGE